MTNRVRYKYFLLLLQSKTNGVSYVYTENTKVPFKPICTIFVCMINLWNLTYIL